MRSLSAREVCGRWALWPAGSDKGWWHGHRDRLTTSAASKEVTVLVVDCSRCAIGSEVLWMAWGGSDAPQPCREGCIGVGSCWGGLGRNSEHRRPWGLERDRLKGPCGRSSSGMAGWWVFWGWMAKGSARDGIGGGRCAALSRAGKGDSVCSRRGHAAGRPMHCWRGAILIIRVGRAER